MIPNRTLETTRPTREPTLRRTKVEKNAVVRKMELWIGFGVDGGTRRLKTGERQTYMNDIAIGSLRGVSDIVSMFSIKCAKQPVMPPMTKLVIRSTLGTRSSETIVVHPRFSKSSVEWRPASTRP